MATLNIHYQDMQEEVLDFAKKVSLSFERQKLDQVLSLCSSYWRSSRTLKKNESLPIKSDKNLTKTMVSIFAQQLSVRTSLVK